MLQLIDGKTKLEDYKNGFVNLALPFFGFSEPIAPKKSKYGETEWTLWDRFEFKNDPTLKEFIEWFSREHKLDVSMVSQGVSMLWSSFIGKKKSEERLPMKFSKLVEHVSKKPVPSHTKHLIVEVMVSDEEGEDVEVCNFLLSAVSTGTDGCRNLGSFHRHSHLGGCRAKCADYGSVQR